MVNRVAYYLALIALVTVPATLVAWLLIHGLVSFWRRMGATKAAVSVSLLTILVAAAMYLVHEPLLRVHLGFHWPLVTVAVALLGLSGYLNARVYRETPKWMALGLAELSSDASGQLITTGLYSRLRHPRFAAMALAVAAIALLTNYAALYALFGLYAGVIFVIALLEERELAERFGREYVEYARAVPRFIPRVSGQTGGVGRDAI